MKHFFTIRFLSLCALVAVTFIGTVAQTSAQKYVFKPSKTITAEWNGTESINVDVDIKNMTAGELQLSWAVIENNIPMNWMFSLCDNINCYSSSVIPAGGADFFPVEKDGKAFFKLIFDSSGTFNTTTTIKLAVWETGKKQDGIDTVLFSIIPKASGVTESTTPFAAVLPNPTNDLVHLSAFNAVQTVEVFSAVGVKVMEVANNSAEVSLDVRSLPVGVYFVKARDIYGKINTATFHKF